MENEESQSDEEVSEAPQQFSAPAEAPVDIPEDEMLDEEDDDSMPFPNARVIRLIREELKSGKQIRGEVKVAINIWLGNLLKKIAKEMDCTQYGSIGISDFQRATKPYDMIEDIVRDRDRLMVCLEKMKQDADQVKRDMSRFFVSLTGKLPEGLEE
jgi:hypothetical protein